MRVDGERGVTLTLDADMPVVPASDAVLSLDEVERSTVARCEARVCRAKVSDAPKLAQRLQVSEDPVYACVREAQAPPRR